MWRMVLAIVGGMTLVAVCGCGGDDPPPAGNSFLLQVDRARQEPDPLRRARTLRDIAKRQHQAKDVMGADATFRDAREAAARIEDPSDRASEFAYLAGAMAETGDTSDAKKAVSAAEAALEKIEDPVAQTQAMSLVAKAQVSLDERNGAVSLLRKAVPIAEGISDAESEKLRQEQEVSALLAIASAWRYAGRDDDAQATVDKALAVAEGIPTPRGQADALANIWVALSRMDSPRAQEIYDRALAAAREIDDALSKGHALAEIAMKLQQTGQAAQAGELLDEAEQVANTRVGDTGLRRELLDKINDARS